MPLDVRSFSRRVLVLSVVTIALVTKLDTPTLEAACLILLRVLALAQLENRGTLHRVCCVHHNQQNMEFTRFNFGNAPEHYEINAFIDNKWVGHYQKRDDWIENVYINEKMRGRGLCTKLMEHATNGKDNLRVAVNPENIPAIYCYRAVGFKELTTIDGLTIMKLSRV